jgi:hypothetical protein
LSTDSTRYGKTVLDAQAKFAPGEKLYLDKDIKEMISGLTELFHVNNSDELHDLVRKIDYVTKKFKVMNTIYWPGFHIKNTLSDIVFGALDKVKLKDYQDVFTAFPVRDRAWLDIGGNRRMKFNDLWDLFERSATSGGYISTEMGEAGILGSANVLQRAGQTARSLSTGREDIGRFVHFVSAMRDEYPMYIRRGFGKDKALEYATNSLLQFLCLTLSPKLQLKLTQESNCSLVSQLKARRCWIDCSILSFGKISGEVLRLPIKFRVQAHHLLLVQNRY